MIAWGNNDRKASNVLARSSNSTDFFPRISRCSPLNFMNFSFDFTETASPQR